MYIIKHVVSYNNNYLILHVPISQIISTVTVSSGHSLRNPASLTECIRSHTYTIAHLTLVHDWLIGGLSSKRKKEDKLLIHIFGSRHERKQKTPSKSALVASCWYYYK